MDDFAGRGHPGLLKDDSVAHSDERSEAWDSHWPPEKSPMASPLNDLAARVRGALSEDEEDADTVYTDELLKLRSAVNEKELELVELRESHMHLLERSAEARTNWEEAVASKDRAIDQLQEALRAKEKALERMDGNLREAKKQLQDAQGLQAHKISELEGMVDDLKEENDAHQKQRQKDVSEIKALRSQHQTNREDLAVASEQQQGIEHALTRQQKQLEALDKENRQLRSSLEAAERMTEKLRKDLMGQQDVTLQASQAKELMAREIQSRVEELQSQMVELQQGVASKEASVQRHREKNKRLQAELKLKLAALEQAGADKQQLQAEVGRLRTVNTELDQHCNKLKRAAVSLEEKLAAVREELSAAKRWATDSDLTDMVDGLRAELRQSRQEAEDLAAELAKQKGAHASDVRRKLHSLEKKHRLQMQEAKLKLETRIAELEAALHRERMLASVARMDTSVQEGRHRASSEDLDRQREETWRRMEEDLRAQLRERDKQLAEAERFQAEGQLVKLDEALSYFPTLFSPGESGSTISGEDPGQGRGSLTCRAVGRLLCRARCSGKQAVRVSRHKADRG
ncbi:hypothetical protein KFL_002320210 [Klebsormidium nitens]|uniref:Uncharacterized protein n=1 Tax=Klebsormidium nitens TaxID=105231 RepID=A0A1Y1I9J7_KLENI|nr:hypothetical protein KFL_002320210 [Klebsormidium nitens]|eukprot:GAQ85387.1 hypothetical protein KFL_002320210 [Klebsormidium nitens]